MWSLAGLIDNSGMQVLNKAHKTLWRSFCFSAFDSLSCSLHDTSGNYNCIL